MRTFLVTGGAGFIGSHVCLMLLQNKCSLYILDSFTNSFPESLDRVKLISRLDEKYDNDKISIFEGDLRDKNSIKKVFYDFKNKGKNIDGVIHLAGFKSVSQSIINPLSYWENNVISTIPTSHYSVAKKSLLNGKSSYFNNKSIGGDGRK